jgi:hydrogenase maturation protein HypF
VSQYLGDLSSYDTQVNYEHTVDHLLGMMQVVPDKILIDQHPDYFSSALGKRFADRYKAEVDRVQHHEAHFSAVLAENQLMQSKEPVLGVIWDGTGWGEDSAIWGGEFFNYEKHSINRITHLDYFDHILGDKQSREPRLSALSLCKTIPEAKALLLPKFSGAEWDFFSQTWNKHNLIRTSSMGRLFDGVASLLGLCDKSTYEGEAAMYLETLARKAKPEDPWIFDEKFSRERLIEKVVDELLFGTATEQVAYQFHRALVNWIEQVAVDNQIHQLAFSGGVFQNSLLVDLIIDNLSESFELYFHKQLSPNDECIGFGQLAYDQIKKESCVKKNINVSHVIIKTKRQCV